jgi:hypothetical protein
MIAGTRSRLIFLQLQNLFLHRIARDQPICKNRPDLPDAVRPVDRLGFDRGVPPRIQEENVLGRSQIEDQSPGLQADQE